MQKRAQKCLPPEAVEETLRLYHAWLGALLTRLGEGEVRVNAREITEGLTSFRCEVRREGEEYVILLDRRDAEERERREAAHGGENA